MRAGDFQALAENASDMVLRSDLSGRFVYISSALSRISGYAPGELVGTKAVDLVYPEDIPALVAACQAQVASNGAARPLRIRYRCKHKDGRTIWFEAQPTLLKDPQTGEALGFSDIVRDITETVARDAALAASEAQLRFLNEHTHDVIIRVDRTELIVYVSPSCRRYGYEPEELIGTAGYDLMHPEDGPRIRAIIGDMFVGRENRDANREQRIRTKAGDWVWMEGAPTIIRDEQGLPVEYVSVLRDISTRKAAEAAMAESELRFRQLAEHTTDLVIRYDTKGVIEYASPSVRRLGYEPEQVVGRNMADFTHPDDNDAAQSRRGALAAGQSIAADTPRKTRARRADGGWAWLEGTGVPVRDPAGHVTGVVTVLRDVSAREAAEAALAESEERFRRLAENATDVIASCSPDGLVTYVSPSAERVFGYSPEELLVCSSVKPSYTSCIVTSTLSPGVRLSTTLTG